MTNNNNPPIQPDFKSVESSRPPFDEGTGFSYTKTIKPDWVPGSGANNDDWKNHKTVEIDPYGEGRKPVDNYKLLISGIIPRPVLHSPLLLSEPIN